MIRIFIGYDEREAIAYHVCSNSIIVNASTTISITPLAPSLISNYQETHTDGSNSFTYTRFLTPYLTNFNGWAIFIDGDMILKDDIINLWKLRDDKFAVQVVKHNYTTSKSIKYLGSKNEDYPRKNWSSVVLWNCEHIKNKMLTPSFIKNSSGQFLHRFSWLSDDDIGELPIEWNWLPDELGINLNAKLLHYTLGTPCFNQFSTGPMTDEWHAARHLTEYHKVY
jgi:lipopolysaccharide biosynthesis glycosyltransferase